MQNENGQKYKGILIKIASKCIIKSYIQKLHIFSRYSIWERANISWWELCHGDEEWSKQFGPSKLQLREQPARMWIWNPPSQRTLTWKLGVERTLGPHTCFGCGQVSGYICVQVYFSKHLYAWAHSWSCIFLLLTVRHSGSIKWQFKKRKKCLSGFRHFASLYHIHELLLPLCVQLTLEVA